MFYQTYGELVERRNNQWAYESGYLQPDKWLEQRRHKKAHRRGYLKKKNSLFDGEEYIWVINETRNSPMDPSKGGSS